MGRKGGAIGFGMRCISRCYTSNSGVRSGCNCIGAIGACLEAGYGARAREIAAQLAIHFERGGEVRRALHYLQQAGDNAARRHAHHEAIAVLTRGLALLATLPESPTRTQHEITLLLILGQRLMVAKGYAARGVVSLHAVST
jgi:predicted ATPase